MRSPNDLFRKRRMLSREGIMTALGRGDARKQVERALGCTRSQAWEMVYRGRVPGKFRAALIGLLEEAIVRQQMKLRDIDEQLRGIAHEEMLARAAARRDEMAADYPNALPRLFDRSEDA